MRGRLLGRPTAYFCRIAPAGGTREAKHDGSRGSSANERYAAIVQDLRSGQRLFARAADEPLYPASLTKMMTLYVLIQDLQRGPVSLTTPLVASPQAEAQPLTELGLVAVRRLRSRTLSELW
jgi:D-alanyl-D-alanine carboxypeptidase